MVDVRHAVAGGGRHFGRVGKHHSLVRYPSASGRHRVAGGGCYLLACSLVFAKYRRLAEWREMATLVDMVRCKALLLRGLKINILLYMAGFCVALVLAHQVEPRMASPDVWGGWGWVLYKALAATLAIFMAQRGVGMVCKSMDYNRMRASGRVA